LNFEQFIVQPVNHLLQALPTGYADVKIVGSVRAHKARYLYVYYAPKTVVVIAVKNFRFMDPSPVSGLGGAVNWDISLFKLEAISFVVAFNGNCINGCADEDKIN